MTHHQPSTERRDRRPRVLVYLRAESSKEPGWPANIEFGTPDSQEELIERAAKVKRLRLSWRTEENEHTRSHRYAFHALLRIAKKQRTHRILIATPHHLALDPDDRELLVERAARQGVTVLFASEEVR